VKNLVIVALVAVVALVLISVPQMRDTLSPADPATLNQRGLASYFGSGVEKDLEKARELFQQAAEQGDASAQVNLGMMYDHGDGAPRDYAMARHWYQKAADQGDRAGRILLGYMYFYGLGGEDDHKKAMYYFIAANSEIKATDMKATDMKAGTLMQRSDAEVAFR